MINRDLPQDAKQNSLLGKEGLSTSAAVALRAKYGHNDILMPRPSPWHQLALDTARDPMIWFLLAMSLLYGAVGETRDALILLAALLPLVGMDAYLHHRTMVSTQSLAQRLAATCTAIRDGQMQTLATRDLVPGDLVELLPGAAIPADGLVLSGTEIQVDESSLTGESYPARKSALPVALADTTAPMTTIAENWVLAGTRLLAGTARIRVAYTGAATLYGEIARSAMIGVNVVTPIQYAIRRLVGILLIIALAICTCLAAIRLWQGYDMLDAVMSALTLAVAALPEEFPIVFTFYLGVGVYRLAQRKALVRRAVAVENIGRVTCICSDKTGTLTEGRLELMHCESAAGTPAQQLVSMAESTADPASTDPLDMALSAWLQRNGIDSCERHGARLATYPFTEARRRETAILQQPDGTRSAVVKGAPETVLAMCADTADQKAAWLAMVDRYAAGGHKVIACASRSLPESEGCGEEPEDGYAFAGLMAFEDRLRDGVREAVAACRRSGIRVVVVTGDHPITARAIGAEIGLRDGDPIVAIADTVLGVGADPALMARVDVIARAAPAQKVDLVTTLQASGEIVAVTGDGINDVPALQAADIGIAMGERGTQSAREIAAIVLLDDNFRTITRAIAEGRQLFDNLSRSFAYLLAVHIALVSTAAVVPMLGYPLLYLPVHIIWLELIIHPTALLVFQVPARPDIDLGQARQSARFFDQRAWLVLIGVGVVLAMIIAALFIFALEQQMDVAAARALALVALISAGATVTLVLNPRPGRAGWLVVGGSILSCVIFVQVPALAAWVHLAPLPVAYWLTAALIGAGGGSLIALWRGRQSIALPTRHLP